MKLFDTIRTASSNLLRNKGRSFLTILAVFIGCFTIILTTGINAGVNDYIDKQMASAGGEGYIEIMPDGSMDMMSGGMMNGNEIVEYNPDKDSVSMEYITRDDIVKIESIDGVEFTEVYTQVSPEYISSELSDKKFQLQISAMPSDTLNIDMASGRMVDIHSDKPEIAIDEKYVTALGFSSNDNAVGQTVKIAIMSQITKKITEIQTTISGVLNPSIVSMGRSWSNKTLQNKLYDVAMENMPTEYKDRYYIASVQLTDEYSTNDEKIQTVKDELKNMGFSAMTIADSVGMVKTFFDAITVVLLVFGIIALLAASIGIINTLFMAVQERTREIGLMKAMGLGNGKIRLMFSIEAIALGFWGSMLGLAVAYIASIFINQLANETFLSGLPGFTLIKFDVVSLIVMIIVVMFIAFLSGTLPARRASKLDPIDALRYE